jgi:hypothetical protein
MNWRVQHVAETRYRIETNEYIVRTDDSYTAHTDAVNCAQPPRAE